MSEPATNLPAFNEIAAALAKARPQFTVPKRTKKGQQGNRTFLYAPLEEVNAAVDPALCANGLSCPSYIEWIDGYEFVTTDLIHTSGQIIRSRFRLSAGLGVQDRGKEQTYGHRYNKRLLLDLTDGDADLDDGGTKGGGAESGGEKAIRDELVERMGRASLGNHAILTYTKANNLGDGSTVEDLPVATVQKLLDTWDDVVEAIRKAKAEKPKAKQVEKPAEKPEDKPATTALYGIDNDLAALMTRDGITPDQLKAYYSGAGHLPATVEPAKLPASYIKAITTETNWNKAVSKMKETK